MLYPLSYEGLRTDAMTSTAAQCCQVTHGASRLTQCPYELPADG